MSAGDLSPERPSDPPGTPVIAVPEVVADLADPVGRVLLSGPIGSGKSTVGSLMGELGATVIEADSVGHDVLEPDGEAFDAVVARWPDVVVDGRVDRGRLAAIVFADSAELAILESFTHPAISGRITEMVQATEAASPGVVAVELPLLVDLLGAGWHRVVVTADVSVRRARAVDRGMDPADVDRRIAAQPPMGEWLARADSTIPNDGDLAALRQRVTAWWDQHVGPRSVPGVPTD
ncbi:dephospho-CoA kinase [Ilumatobacter sp.]|uniref:dephospho-CoA kinase n=1 Tax=Ilumatobacter sp. TaxID=1967498 RepID=UPI003C5D309B